MENDERVSRAEAALEEYYSDEDACLRDLLADLMHWAASKGVDFFDELRIAEGTYAEEGGGHI